MLNHQRELTLPRPTAAPTATSSAYFLTLQFLRRQARGAGAALRAGAHLGRREQAGQVRHVLPRKPQLRRAHHLRHADPIVPAVQRPQRPTLQGPSSHNPLFVRLGLCGAHS